MCINSFNDAHVLVGPIRGRSGSVKTLDQHRLVANAVPPLLAEVMGKSIVSQFFKEERQTQNVVLQSDYCCQISP